MMTILASVFLLIGGFFALVAALGVFRFSDFYARVHAATKASTFGFGFTLLAAAMVLGTASAWSKAALALAFLFITLPVAAHLLSRSVKSSAKQVSPVDQDPR
jgi:multicomponent Na+:H+ antiporter subunit G